MDILDLLTLWPPFSLVGAAIDVLGFSAEIIDDSDALSYELGNCEVVN